MKKMYLKALLCATAAVGLFVLAQGGAEAGTMSGLCVKCHTMHNSQDGSPMTSGTNTAQPQLLRVAGCIGCHQGPPGTPVSADYSAPIVLHTGSAPANTSGSDTLLAGGSFYWVSTAGPGLDNRGHNVDELASDDLTLADAPGNDGTWLGTGGDLNRIKCVSCHLTGAHHYNEGGDYTSGTKAYVDGTTAGKSYRFLSVGGPGVIGGEDSDWEWTFGSNDHNVYYAEDAGGADPTATDTFNYFCARCHGDFHGDYNAADDTGAGLDSNNAWRRHPTDYALSDAGGEYLDYNTRSGNTDIYAVQAPVGTSTTATQVSPTAFTAVGANTDIIVCTSCHRAHGSPYADMLRWTYDMDAGDTTNADGCFVCHTTK